MLHLTPQRLALLARVPLARNAVAAFGDLTMTDYSTEGLLGSRPTRPPQIPAFLRKQMNEIIDQIEIDVSDYIDNDPIVFQLNHLRKLLGSAA